MNWLLYRFIPWTHRSKVLKRLPAVLLLLAITMSLSSCNFNRDAAESPEPGEESPTPGIDAVPPDVKDTPEPTQEPSAEPSVPAEPVVEPPDIPEGEPVGDEYFEDAAFMGNSLMNGFEMYAGISTADYYTATSMTVMGAGSKYCVTLENGNAGTMIDGLTQKSYGKIYILLGVNEIGYEVSYFIDQYSAMLDKIIEAQPDCIMYIVGISPVSMAKSSSDPSINMDRVELYNEALYELAKEKGCYFLDLVDALAGDDGYLPANETTDGVHFSANLYGVWADYVRTHYIVPEEKPVEFEAPESETEAGTEAE